MKAKNYMIILFSMIILSCTSNKTEEKEVAKDEHAHHDHSAHAGASNSKSPRTAAMANIGSNHVHIDYSAPSVRGREIFGGLVAYDEVWVTGAHSAASISFNQDLEIEGEVIPAGKYALFTIPGKESWTVILNTNYKQHLADDYDESEDVARFEVPSIRLDEAEEQLKFEVTAADLKTGVIWFKWAGKGFMLGIVSKS
ncbi:hypothetical protein ADIS_0976 [Lunatimonas lonarensis]|uniref:DUF2911 domain-containing protein n=1 Tax=Lunatimonas lonarensis TaxID=1232681 RepID=R7ZWW6_9BACT|nr:DUF2911 domain-containing protein [Lunatimonas lonarensis]EON78626.1 hypothetical protein ADIS_0976 [Lunatimonas lonarensis]